MPDEFQTLKIERCIEIIKAYNGSGMPKRQWCREHGISCSTFIRWQRSLRMSLRERSWLHRQWLSAHSIQNRRQNYMYCKLCNFAA